MATVELKQEDFVQTIQGSDTVFVDFWASWCGPCLRFGPVYEAAAQKHPDVVFAKVDTEDQRALAGGLEIQAIPTLMAFRGGYLVYREAGALSAQQFDKLVQTVTELDIEKLKAAGVSSESA